MTHTLRVRAAYIAAFLFAQSYSCAVATALDKQRIYLFPQTIYAGGSHEGIIEGMCVDPKAPGIPGSSDAITNFSNESAIVVHRIENGHIVESKPLAEKNAAIRLVGASDAGSPGDLGIANVRAFVVNPEKGVTYKLEVTKGLVCSRKEEPITDDLRKRIGEFHMPISSCEQTLADLATSLGPSSPARQLFKQHMQQSVLWRAQSGADADAAKESAEQFLKTLLALAKSDSAEVNWIMACLLSGKTPLDQKAIKFFMARNVALADPMSTAIEKAIAKKLTQWRKTRSRYAVEFAMYRPQLEAFKRVRQTALEIVSAIKASERFRASIAGMQEPTFKRLSNARRLFDSLRHPDVTTIALREGEILFNDGKDGWLDINEAIRADAPPSHWKAFERTNTVFDIEHLPPEQLPRLLEKFEKMEEKHGLRLNRHFLGDPRNEKWRTNMLSLLDIGRLDVAAAMETVQNHPRAAQAFLLIDRVAEKTSARTNGPDIRVIHTRGDLIARVKEDRNGFNGRNKAYIFCFELNVADVISDICKMAFKQGALSVWTPTARIDPNAAALVILMLWRYPEIFDARTPGMAISKACNRAMSLLDARDPLKAIEAAFGEFGPAAVKLFQKDGSLDREAIGDAKEGLNQMDRRACPRVGRRDRNRTAFMLVCGPSAGEGGSNGIL